MKVSSTGSWNISVGNPIVSCFDLDTMLYLRRRSVDSVDNNAAKKKILEIMLLKCSGFLSFVRSKLKGTLTGT